VNSIAVQTNVTYPMPISRNVSLVTVQPTRIKFSSNIGLYYVISAIVLDCLHSFTL